MNDTITDYKRQIKDLLKNIEFVDMAFMLAESQNIDIKEIVHEVYPIEFLRKYTGQLTGYVLEKNVKQCLEIKFLYLYNNQLTSIPKELGNLSSLIALHLYNNQLTSVPKELGNLTSLEYLHLYNNPNLDLNKLPENFKELL